MSPFITTIGSSGPTSSLSVRIAFFSPPPVPSNAGSWTKRASTPSDTCAPSSRRAASARWCVFNATWRTPSAANRSSE